MSATERWPTSAGSPCHYCGEPLKMGRGELSWRWWDAEWGGAHEVCIDKADPPFEDNSHEDELQGTFPMHRPTGTKDTRSLN